MEIEIKQIRDVLLKSYDHSFQEQELEVNGVCQFFFLLNCNNVYKEL